MRLPGDEPIYCLAAEKVIAAKKQSTIDEVQQAEAEAITIPEVAAAAEAADTHAAQEAAAEAYRLAAELEAQEAAQRAEAAQKADAQAQALAKAAGDDSVEEQARQLEEYSRKRSRAKAALIDAIDMKQLVRNQLAEADLTRLSLQRVQLEIERALELNAEELKPRRSEIKGCIDMVLNECACCLADLSGHPSRDELEDPRDLRKYCIPCWKAYAMRRDEMR